jgi:threonine aldolase
MKIVDLRSDTVTVPTPAMREAMAQAEVGDDVMGEDPTVNLLQEISAEKMGKEAVLFVPSGTMGNLAAILTHCNRGDEVILGNKSHIFLNTAGGISALGGVHSFPLDNRENGTLALDDIRSAFRSITNPHHPITRLITIENTHNRCGGVSLSADYTKKLCELAKTKGLKVHLDGARIFNAAIDLGVNVKDLVNPVDTVMFCLSKGLSAPVGSVICGSGEFISRALRIRKQLGGGMRQAGIIAAAAIIAIEEMAVRLREDHESAYRLAVGLSKIHGLSIDITNQHTNMVYPKLNDDVPMMAWEVAKKLRRSGIKMGVVNERQFRLVTHYGIESEDVNYAVLKIREFFEGL